MMEGTVLSRPNRFMVRIDHDGMPIPCHLHDPGRLKEVIFPGNRVLFRRIKGAKTDYSIAAGMNNGIWVPIDTRIHGAIAEKFLARDFTREVTIGRKRIDYMVGGSYLEVKGCTLNMGGKAMFPDAPSRRASEHLRLLSSISMNGGSAYVLILVLRADVDCFAPNAETDPEFARALIDAIQSGVRIEAHSLSFDSKRVYYDKRLPFCGEFTSS